MKLLMVLVLLIVGAHAHASSLFYESCTNQSHSSFTGGGANEGGAPFVLVSNQSRFGGMTCQDLKSLFEAAQIANLVLMPATLAIKAPGVAESLAIYGLTLANPAVLTVTVVGATGYALVYLIMKQSIKECDARAAADLKADILKQIKATFPGIQNSNPHFEIKHEGDSI